MGASRTAIDVALKRLVDQGDIQRAGRGVFYVPKSHPILGVLAPPAQDLAEALAQRSGARLFLTGSDAANRLGLSTQVPARAVFYTTGTPVRRKLGNRTLELRHRSLRMAAAASIVAAVIEALRTLGKKEAASAQVRKHLRRILTREQKKTLAEQLHLAPEWMRRILRSVLSSPRPSA
jgi:hypothetical protein